MYVARLWCVVCVIGINKAHTGQLPLSYMYCVGINPKTDYVHIYTSKSRLLHFRKSYTRVGLLGWFGLHGGDPPAPGSPLSVRRLSRNSLIRQGHVVGRTDRWKSEAARTIHFGSGGLLSFCRLHKLGIQVCSLGGTVRPSARREIGRCHPRYFGTPRRSKVIAI